MATTRLTGGMTASHGDVYLQLVQHVNSLVKAPSVAAGSVYTNIPRCFITDSAISTHPQRNPNSWTHVPSETGDALGHSDKGIGMPGTLSIICSCWRVLQQIVVHMLSDLSVWDAG